MGLDASFAVTAPGAARLASVAICVRTRPFDMLHLCDIAYPVYPILYPILFYTFRYDEIEQSTLSVLLLCMYIQGLNLI